MNQSMLDAVKIEEEKRGIHIDFDSTEEMREQVGVIHANQEAFGQMLGQAVKAACQTKRAVDKLKQMVTEYPNDTWAARDMDLHADLWFHRVMEKMSELITEGNKYFRF